MHTETETLKLKNILQNNDLCQRHHRNKDAETIYNNTKCTHSITFTQLQERNQRSIDAQEIPTQLEKKASKIGRCKKNYNNTEICQSSNYLHTETETMKLKKFDDSNIENPVNIARNLKDILQNNDLCP